MTSPQERLEDVRRRRPAIDHVVRMQEHYGEVKASQQAGAITYFAFLSFFPILALAFFVVGLVSEVYPGANQAMQEAITAIFPGIIGNGENELKLGDFRTFSGLAGIIGFVGVLYAGLGWVSALRLGLAAVFEKPEAEQLGFVPGKLRDLVTLVSIGAVLFFSVVVSSFVSRFSVLILDLLTLDEELSWLVKGLTLLLGFAANVLLFFAMFRLLGGSHTPRRSLLHGALLGAVLFEVLKRLAGLLIAQTEGQPAFQAFGIALVMVVWMNYFSRIVLYAAAWAHTSPEARAQRDRAALDADRADYAMKELTQVELRETAPAGSSRISPKAAFAAGGATMLGLVALARRKKDDQ